METIDSIQFKLTKARAQSPLGGQTVLVACVQDMPYMGIVDAQIELSEGGAIFRLDTLESREPLDFADMKEPEDKAGEIEAFDDRDCLVALANFRMFAKLAAHCPLTTVLQHALRVIAEDPDCQPLIKVLGALAKAKV